jgi:hypothetical protein
VTLPICHAPSLRRPLRHSTPVDFKRHHYPLRSLRMTDRKAGP